MSNQPQADLKEATARLEKDLLARLGLGSGASNEQIESAHEEVAQYLDKAPSGLRAWSGRQAASIDEAYALLRGPREELVAAAARLVAAIPASAPAAVAATAARPPVKAPAPASRPAGRHAMDGLDDAGADWLDETELEPSPRKGRAAVRPATAVPPRRGINPVLKKAGIAVAGIVAVAAIALGGYNLGAPKGTPAPSAAAADTAFQAQVASLMQKLTANPSDTSTLMDLANVYYTSGDYSTANTWIQKLLAIDPKSIDGLLAYGAASFNLADYTAAEKSWKQVLEIDPANLEAYYDLGFLYFSDNPPNIELTRQMWNKVVELSPDSQIAKTVASHLKSLDSLASGTPSGSAAPTASAAPSSSPAPSPTK